LEKQATKVARANAEVFCQSFHSSVTEATLADEAQSARNRIWRPQPGGSSGRTFWPATQTGTKARLRRRSGSGIVSNILFFRRRRWTNRAAIDAAREHSNKELAIEARVARYPSSRTYLPIQLHFFSEAYNSPPRAKTWTFSDFAGSDRIDA
jgi:hypothetical protein